MSRGASPIREERSGNGPASLSEPVEHWQVRVTGTVQGVGFRPFIFHLARQHHLLGTVLNDSRGVVICAQGSSESLRSFVAAIRSDAPAAARVNSVETSILPLADYTEFRILASEPLGETFTQVSPDLALCSDCRRELLDPSDRRFGYPFINCTNCGPRFTIIRGVPYDRPLTTMSEFELCPACRAEYENPVDRRFHAQPVACAECGPELRFVQATADGWCNAGTGGDPVLLVAAALNSGHIVLVQGIGGFHLACDARDDRLVGELRRRKKRDEKPFAVMFPSEESLAQSCLVSEVELAFLRSYRAPILLMKRRATSPVALSVAPGNPYLGGMLPYSPLHVVLLAKTGIPLVMTSANLSDEPIAYDVNDALRRMHGIADGALLHNRPIHMFADDSVVKVAAGAPRVWRRSRGYVPEAVHVPKPFRGPVLAFGPQLKNTFCLGKQDFALLSQHVGDMESDLSVRAHQTALDHFLRLYDARIELVACDLHPDYATTRLAEKWSTARSLPLIRVQHHHAHLAACLAENERTETAIGLCLDGTGYGSDSMIWGGEILIGDPEGFKRVGHLQTVPLLGGEKAAQEPWRMALAWLHEAFEDRAIELPLRLVRTLRTDYGETALRNLLNPNLRGQLYPLTSSLGRLFDAVAALLFFGTRRQHEGQAAMLLEGMMSPDPEPPYPFEISEDDQAFILLPRPMLRALTEDLQAGVEPAVVSRRFHEGVAAAFVRACENARERTGVQTVALSGGCFQNSFLLSAMEDRLSQLGFLVLSHRTVPANDGGVALGQAVIANAQVK
jgi:hydrogenase maturation protein HypF